MTLFFYNSGSQKPHVGFQGWRLWMCLQRLWRLQAESTLCPLQVPETIRTTCLKAPSSIFKAKSRESPSSSLTAASVCSSDPPASLCQGIVMTWSSPGLFRILSPAQDPSLNHTYKISFIT